MSSPPDRRTAFPLGAAVTLDELERDPHPTLRRLREAEPVSWVPAIDGWLVTAHDLASEVMRDAATFTVDDPRFSTAQVVGPSMLSLDGPAHARQRGPFVSRFHRRPLRESLAPSLEAEVDRLLEGVRPDGAGDLRRALAAPLSVRAMCLALGLDADPSVALGWYEAIVADVTAITAGSEPSGRGRDARDELGDAVARSARSASAVSVVVEAGGTLDAHELVANVAVLLFGGIETTEATIATAFAQLLSRPEELARVRADPALVAVAVEETLRLEPAASVVDRYATRPVTLGGARIGERELVRVSLAGANRDPAAFAEPDRYDLDRTDGRRHLTFAHGPHVCIGLHLARLEAELAVGRALAALPGLRLDPGRPTPDVRGLVFRKPPSVDVVWKV